MQIKPIVNKAVSLLRDHLPEILTIVACAGIPLGDIFLIRADRAYKVDGLKRHYVIPITIHGVSFLCIILSNRVSNAQKVSLIAAGAVSAGRLQDYKDITRKEVGDKKADKINEKFEDLDLNRIIIEAEEADELNFKDIDDRKIFYFPQLYEACVCTDQELDYALQQLNNILSDDNYSNEARVSDFFYNLGDVMITHNNDNLTKSSYGWKIYDGDIGPWFTDISLDRNTKKVRSGREVTYCYFSPEPLRFDEWPEQFKRWEERIEEEITKNG